MGSGSFCALCLPSRCWEDLVGVGVFWAHCGCCEATWGWVLHVLVRLRTLRDSVLEAVQTGLPRFGCCVRSGVLESKFLVWGSRRPLTARKSARVRIS